MRQSSLFLFSLFCALIFIAGCNPPSNPACSPYIGQATINEVSKVQQNNDSGSDFIEIRILSASLTASTLNNWKVLVCERGTSTCGAVQLSSATVTGTGANRYYVVKSLSNIGSYISFTNTSTTGTEVALADQNDDVIDYLSVGGYTAHQPSGCTFPYDTDATTSSSTRRVQRIPDGTGNWDVVSSGNSSPPTEGSSNDTVPPVTPAHFEIDDDGAGITCAAEAVTIRLHDASHNLLTGYTGTITVSTATGIGNWTLSSGSGGFSNGTVGDGSATYTFAATESQVTLLLTHFNTGTVNINVTNGSVTETTGGFSSHDDNIAFTSAGLIVAARDQSTSAVTTVLPTQISGKSSAVGWNRSDFILRAVQTNQTTYQCEALTMGTRAVALTYQCMSPTTCASNDALSLSGTAIPDNPASGVTSSPATVNLTFDAQATAVIPLIFLDAGQVRLNASTSITDSAGSSLQLAGSGTFTVRPFGFGFSPIVSGTTVTPSGIANAAGTASSGNGFIAAGSAFSATVAAYRFADGEDNDSNGIPDSNADLTNNGTTPNFAFTGATVSRPTTLMTPLLTAGGVEGAYSGPSSVTLASGSGALNNMTYSEVGSLRLRAAATDYLGVADADIQGDSPDIGRFFPQNFALVSTTSAPITPLITPACPTPTTTVPFTYMGQPFGISYQLEARNTAGVVTRNYDTSANYTAGSSAATIAYVAENANAGTNLAGRVTVPVGRWDNGVYVLADGASNFTVANAVFARSTTTPLVDGPFGSLQLGIVLTDADSRAIASLDMNATTTGTCSTCTAKAIGSPIDIRYGRLALRNTSGSDRARSIVIPALVEFFNGASFARNEVDNCTQYGSTQINDVNYTGTLASSYTDARDTSATTYTSGRWWLPMTNQTMSAGLFQNEPNGLRITPVAGVTSPPVLGVTLNSTAPGTIPAWLLFDWDGVNTTPEDGPSCTVTLGTYRGHDRIILWRER
jgi:MSHA biogenesis protein MshQ